MTSTQPQLNDQQVSNLAYSSLLHYIRLQMPSYEIGRHHYLIAQYLEAVERGDINRLMVFTAPRMGKTMLVSEFFPAWYMGRNPEDQIIATTYSFDRAGDTGRKVRNQLLTDNFKMVFPGCRASPDTKSSNKIATQEGGIYYSVGVGGAITGRGANCLAGSTLIWTNKGLMPIDQLVKCIQGSVRIDVLSFNHSKNLTEFKPVLAVRESNSKDLYEILTKNGKRIYATGDHRFHTANGYTACVTLRSGDRLTALSKQTIYSLRQGNLSFDSPKFEYDTVSAVRRIRGKSIPVYDIQVDENSNFFAEDILTHNCFLIDDPIKGRREAESKSVRDDLIEWFQGVAYTRLMTKNAIILVMTRWHFNDLAGWLLKEQAHEGWVVLNLPAIATEDNDQVNRMKGEPLWPEKFPLERLLQTKMTIGSREWNSQYQQRPLPEEGGLIQLSNFKRYDDETLPAINDFDRVTVSIDTAFTDNEINDPSAMTVWGQKKNDHYLIDVVTRHMQFPQLVKRVKVLHAVYSKLFHGHVRVLVEDKGSGQSLIQELRQKTSIPVIGYKPKLKKELRADSANSLIEAGRVWLPTRAKWLVDFETEIAEFPLGEHDDQVDSVSQYLLWTKKTKYKSTKAKYYK